MVTDRKQLDNAFAHLTHKGYYARSRYWCCNTCALCDIPQEYSERFVFWHEQADDYAFDTDEEEWEYSNTLRNPLFLNWAGDAKEIISTLREFGFTVEFGGPDIDHVDTDEKIRVLPGRVREA